MSEISDDLMAPEVIADPHTYYRQLREADPIHWNDRWGGWVLTRYDDVVKVLRDPVRFSSDRMAYLARELSEEQQKLYAPIFEVLSRWFVFADPPFHTRLRILLNKQFTPGYVERYRPLVRGIVNDLLDSIEPEGRMEVVRDFAYQIPMTVILDLLGAPDVDRERVKEWSEQLGTFFFIRADEPRRREIASEGVTSLVEHLTPVVDERRAQPQDDLISILTQAESRGELAPEDVIATVVLLVFGGHETTMNLICNGMVALMRHADQWERLKRDPGLAATAVEELLRYDGSVKTTVRWAKEDVQLDGRTIQKEQRALIGLSAANRDPAEFENPDSLDLARDPNLHVAFAHGIHVCIGAPLARLEAQEAFTAVTQRLPLPTLETEDLEYVPTVVHRALKALPVTW
ncbi:MAG: cytochrome P450 [Candidatus Methylomirabilales bacterium]